MTLNEALGAINRSRKNAAQRAIFLVCGFQPLHLSTFFQAHATERLQGDLAEVSTGLYGDLPGNLERARGSKATAAAVVLEWGDIDPRLGLRASGGWSDAVKRDIEKNCEERYAQVAALVEQLAANMPVALAGPSLPLPPLGHTVRRQASPFDLALRRQTAAFLQRMSEAGVRVVDLAWLEAASPVAGRMDVKMALIADFPYSLSHADAIAGALVDLLYPAVPKKGLVVDLDNTLWDGILGEVGVEGISWCQERHTHVHALLQQMLGQLAENGVLLAISSKNQPERVEQALARSDLLVPREAFFPVVANWGPKSQAMRGILSAWNIGPDSVVYLDDTPMELSEVQAAYPDVTCLRFNAKDPRAVWEVLLQLRDLFGRPAVFAEDRLRAASIRSATAFRELEQRGTPGAFLHGLEGVVSISYRKEPSDKRPLDLINKTNQFNLNGLRLAEGEWLACLRAAGSIALTASYEDKFGPLGKIAALLGEQQGRRIHVTSWVMSCRAFSRRIEYHTLESLFRVSGAEELFFDFRPTERNQPFQQFFREIGASACDSGRMRLSQQEFSQGQYELPHQLTESLQ